MHESYAIMTNNMTARLFRISVNYYFCIKSSIFTEKHHEDAVFVELCTKQTCSLTSKDYWNIGETYLQHLHTSL